MAEIEQGTGEAQQLLYDIYNRYGQRLTISNRVVSGLAFKAEVNQGAPTGNLTFTIRKVSDDSDIVASKVWGDASAIVDGAWMEATFDTPATVNEEVRIQLEFSGGDVSNRIAVYGTTPSVLDDEAACSYLDASYTERPTWDATYRYTFTGGSSSSPTVTTQACTNTVAQNSLGHGNILDGGDSAITQHGHCWSTTTNPTISGGANYLGAAKNGATANLGQFHSPITVLTPGTKYYVRAYATNSNGTSYGANVEIAGDVTTIGRRHWWVEGKEFHYFDAYGNERKIEGIPDTSGLPWWFGFQFK